MRRLALSLVVLLCAPVSAQAAGSRILATGDSMMRGLDRSLERELGRVQEVSVRRLVHIGEGITNEPWIRIARRKAEEHRPHATVAFMGANDGYPMKGAPCCGRRWTTKYSDRVSRIIDAYTRGGKGEVYWLTLPAASFGRRRQIFPKINRAIRRAVHRSGPHAHLVETWDALSPSGEFRRTMLRNGVEVEVRSPDGIHLKPAGMTMAAELVRDAMLEDGVLTAPDP